MSALRILLVDDEPLVRRDLARILGAEPDVEVVGEARNGIEALEQIELLAPDAVFLDIQMPELDGLGVVAGLDPETAPALVFVTAFDRYALQAFDAEAVDYLLKPFDAMRCRRALERVRLRLAGSRAVNTAQATSVLQRTTGPTPRYLDRLAVRAVKRIVVVNLADVKWIEADDNYVRIHAPEGVFLSRRTIRDLMSLLDPARFIRIHRSTIVNLACVRELRPLGDGDYEATVEGGKRLTVSRSYRDALAAAFGGIR